MVVHALSPLGSSRAGAMRTSSFSVFPRTIGQYESGSRRAFCRRRRPAHPPWQDARYAHERISEEHTSELQSHLNLVCRLLLEKKKDDKQLDDKFSPTVQLHYCSYILL